MSRILTFALAMFAVSIAVSQVAHGAILTENFDNPLGGFYSRWLGQNSNLGSFYLAVGNTSDLDYRGNNSDGLWIADSQVFGGGTLGTSLRINFDPSFGQTLTSLSFGVEAFVSQTISIYDVDGNLLASNAFGFTSPFDHADIMSATSTNGIGSIVFSGSSQISGNTSVDNFVAVTADSAAVPEPTSLAIFGLGACLMGFSASRRRRRRAGRDGKP